MAEQRSGSNVVPSRDQRAGTEAPSRLERAGTVETRQWVLQGIAGPVVADALAQLLALAEGRLAPFTVEEPGDGTVVVTAWGEATQAVKTVIRDQATIQELAKQRRSSSPTLLLRERLSRLQSSQNPEIRELAAILSLLLR